MIHKVIQHGPVKTRKLLALGIATFILIYYFIIHGLDSDKNVLIEKSHTAAADIKLDHVQSNQNEWIRFKKNLEIRRSGVFYFYNDSLVTILAISTQSKISVNMMCEFNINTQIVIKSKVNLKVLSKKGSYVVTAWSAA
jgi:hypothetical protein